MLNVIKSAPAVEACVYNESAMNNFSRGDGIEAARQLQYALNIDPEYDEAWHNRAMVLNALRDPFDAVLCCDKAIELNPYCAIYHNTRGICLASMGMLEDAMLSYDEALLHNRDLAVVWHNKGYAAKLLDRLGDAEIYHGRAVRRAPWNVDYRLAWATALLATGKLVLGWQEFENRFKIANSPQRFSHLPVWEGQKIRGLLLCAEQGYGDTIQFIRYAPVLKQIYPEMQVYVEVKKPLLELARTMIGFDGVIAYGDAAPGDVTHYLPLMSAPIYAGTDMIADIPAPPRFCLGDDANVLNTSEYKVGLCWSAGVRPNQPELRDIAERKSINPQLLKPFAGIENVRWINLQHPIQAPSTPFAMIYPEIHDFYDTARIIRSLDLVVSVDTSVVHLAGALGVNTILMTPKDNCWRWLGDRIASPWYPTLRQYRQPVAGDWSSVIEHVRELITVMARPNHIAAE